MTCYIMHTLLQYSIQYIFMLHIVNTCILYRMYFLQCIVTGNISAKYILLQYTSRKSKVQETGVSHHSGEKKKSKIIISASELRNPYYSTLELKSQIFWGWINRNLSTGISTEIKPYI